MRATAPPLSIDVADVTVAYANGNVALRDAFDDMKRRIEDTVRRRRDAQRQPTPEVRDEVTGDGEPS